MGKNVSFRVLLISGCSLVLAVPTAVRSQAYINIDGGVAFAEEQEVRGLLGGLGGLVAPGTKIEFDPGFRLGVAGGYNFNKIFGAEFETGFIYNSVKEIEPLDMSISHVPLLANLVARYDEPNIPWVAYGGVGVGGDVAIFYAKVPDSITGAGDFDDTEADVRFAWQAQAGLRYKFNDRMQAGVAYKYYWTDVNSWDFKASNQTFTDGVQLGHSKVHSLLVEFSVKF